MQFTLCNFTNLSPLHLHPNLPWRPPTFSLLHPTHPLLLSPLSLRTHKTLIFSSNSPSTPPSNQEEPNQESSLIRDAIAEILEESGVSEAESMEIAVNCRQYAKMLRDGVRDLDELSLWASWMKEEEESPPLSLKKKVKYIAREKGDGGKIAYLESIGLSLSSAMHLSRLLSSDTLSSLIHKVKYVKELFFSGSDDERLIGKSARRMMLHLSISVDEDVQQTLSFFEKIEARRGGLDMLGSKDASFRHLIESFPRLLLLSVDLHIKPLVEFLEDIGVPRQHIGSVLLLFPPLIFLDVRKDIKPGLRAFEKVGASDKEFGRMLQKYPWILSRSIQEHCSEVLSFFDAQKVPKASINQAIRSWPLLLGCSTVKLKPMSEQFDEMGVHDAKIGKVISTSPQLLLRKPDEFRVTVSYMQNLGLDKETVRQILGRCPEIFAARIDNTLQRKVDFLTSIGISKQQLPRVIKKYPEVFVSDVDRSLIPRLKYLKNSGLSDRDIASMIYRFSPILGYNVEKVLRPKLAFLMNTMEKPVTDVVNYPRYFSYSLDKKIKPRFFVLRGRNVTCSLKDMLGKNNEEFATEYLGIGRMLVPLR